MPLDVESVTECTLKILRDLEAVRENLLAFSEEFWNGNDHYDTDALAVRVDFQCPHRFIVGGRTTNGIATRRRFCKFLNCQLPRRASNRFHSQVVHADFTSIQERFPKIDLRPDRDATYGIL